MANLVDRIAERVGEDPADAKISVHGLSAALYFLRIGEITISQIKTAFDMDVLASAQMDLLVLFYQGLTSTDQEEFRERFESAAILLEQGKITKTTFGNLLGIT